MIKKLIRKTKYILRRLSVLPSQYKLNRLKSFQWEKFQLAAAEFENTYKILKKYSIGKYVIPSWKKLNRELEKSFLPIPPFNFLNNQIIVNTMLIKSREKLMKEELVFLEKHFSEKALKNILLEDYAGKPPLANARYLTSHNSIHHAYHLARFFDSTKLNIQKVKTIIEWGGGYGNTAKIIKKISKNPITYIIIDMPLLSCLQKIYLSAVIDKEVIHTITSKNEGIERGKINIIPLCFVENFNLKSDLFISTWALSESSEYAQDYVFGKRWFNAKNLLLAYQSSDKDFPDAERLGRLALESGARIENIPFLPNSHYAFR